MASSYYFPTQADTLNKPPTSGISPLLQESKGPLYNHFVPESVPKQSLAPPDTALTNNECVIELAKLKKLHQQAISEYLVRDDVRKSSATPAPQNATDKEFSISAHSLGELSLEDRVSNAGVNIEAEMAYDASRPRENIRATQGIDPRKELIDWDGITWIPPPLDWETERPRFDPSFIPEYCKEWATDNPDFPVFNMAAEGFLHGTKPVFNHKLGAAIAQPESVPGKLLIPRSLRFQNQH